MRKIKNEIKFPQKNPLETSVVIFIVLSLISCMGLLLFYFNSDAHADCYPNLPVPNLVYTGSEDYQVGGNWFTRYRLEVTNRAEFPNELFVLRPDLPPCGSNPNASRTWVDIYDNDNNYVYGFCAFSSRDDLKSLWFAVLKGTAPPYSVYIKMIDRACNDFTYTSNPSIIGDDFSGEMINRAIWADLEFVRFVGVPMYRSRGPVGSRVLESWLRRVGSNGSNYLVFKNSDTLKSFKADVTVNYFENNGSYPHASLLGYAYKGTSGGATGDVIGVVGIGHNPTLNQLQGFWSISRCTTANCNLPNEYDQICTGSFDTDLGVPSLNTTYPLSFSWDQQPTPTFTFGIGDYTRVIDSSKCPPPGLPTYVGPPDVDTKGIGIRVPDINTGSGDGGFFVATFDNVWVDKGLGLYLYDDFEETSNIDPDNWRTWEFIRAVSDGELISALTQRGVNVSNNMSFVNSQAVLGFEADLKVFEFQNNGARPQGRLYAALYNDGSSSGAGDLTGDVTVSVGISGQGAIPQAFYAVSRCTAPNCNLPGEYEILTQGIFKDVALGDPPHRFSLSWIGSNITLGCDGSAISYNPTSHPTIPAPIAGPPKGRKGIGTRVSEIQNTGEWAYVAAAFDNVVITKMDSDLDGIDDAWEIANFGSTVACDPNFDSDGDFLTNLQEYQYGTNPKQAEGPYTITVESGPNGTVTCTLNPVIYAQGSTCTIAANTGYHVAVVLVDGGSVGAVPIYTFTNVKETHTISASFDIDPTISGREEEIGGLKVCSEFTDASGYPTKMYNCLDPSKSPCNCPQESKEDWGPLKPFSDIQAGLDHITWVGPGPDPLSVDIITGSSTCVRRCYPSGWCYVGPPGCAGSSGLQIAAVASATVLPPPPPVITFRQEKIGDVEICSELRVGDESGCPTLVYSCLDGPSKPWPTAQFSDITAGSGHITWVGIGSDPICPTVNIVTASSTCVKRCYPSGYCVVGPKGCSP